MPKLIFILLLALNICLSAQWVQTSGPCGGIIKTLAVKDSYLFAGTYSGGIYRSNNNGISWVEVNNGLTVKCIQAITSFGNSIFAGTYNCTFRSDDNGDSWTAINGILANKCIYSIDSNDTYIFAGTSDGIFRSSDSGNSWTNCGFSSSINDLIIKEDNIFITVGVDLYRSSNNGATWVHINNGLGDNSVYDLAVDGNNLYAVTTQGGVFLSNNNGENWIAINNGIPIWTTVKAIIVSGSTIYVGAECGLFISQNHGNSWTLVLHESILSFCANKAGVFVGTYGSVYTSIDNGINWNKVNNGLLNASISTISALGNRIFVDAGYAGAYLSIDNGLNWKDLHFSAKAFTVRENNIFAGTSVGVYFSNDDGSTWTPNGLIDQSIYALTFKDNYLFAGTNCGIFRSNNQGGSWIPVNSGVPNSDVYAFAINGNDIFAGTEEGVLLSVNNGSSWTKVNNGLNDIPVYSLALINNNLFAGSYDGIFRTSNNGANWSIVNSDLKFVHSLAVSGTNLFAGAWSYAGVFLSVDSGATWNAVNDGLPAHCTRAIAISNNNIFTGGEFGGSVWKRPLSEMVSISDTQEPSNLSIISNYPNPFNNSTVVNYTLAKSSEINLAVYNSKGELVSNLFKGKQNAGSYSITFNATGLNSGVYYIRMKYGSNLKTHKILLVK